MWVLPTWQVTFFSYMNLNYFLPSMFPCSFFMKGFVLQLSYPFTFHSFVFLFYSLAYVLRLSSNLSIVFFLNFCSHILKCRGHLFHSSLMSSWLFHGCSIFSSLSEDIRDSCLYLFLPGCSVRLFVELFCPC